MMEGPYYVSSLGTEKPKRCGTFNAAIFEARAAAKARCVPVVVTGYADDTEGNTHATDWIVWPDGSYHRPGCWLDPATRTSPSPYTLDTATSLQAVARAAKKAPHA